MRPSPVKHKQQDSCCIYVALFECALAVSRVGTTGCWCPLLPVVTMAISISSRPQHDGLRGQSWSACPGLSSLSLLFSPSTALLTTKSLHRPRLWYSTARLLISRHTRLYYSQHQQQADLSLLLPAACLSDSAICTEIRETNPSHIIRYSPTLAIQYRPIALAHANPRSRLQPAQPILRYSTRPISNRPDPTLPHSSTPLKPSIDCHDCHRDCASTRMSSSSN
jgi:hypothetical protein